MARSRSPGLRGVSIQDSQRTADCEKQRQDQSCQYSESVQLSASWKKRTVRSKNFLKKRGGMRGRSEGREVRRWSGDRKELAKDQGALGTVSARKGSVGGGNLGLQLR